MSASYITMKSSDVKKLIEVKLQLIKNLREAHIQAYVDEERERYIKRSKSLLGRLFKTKVPSDEEIRAREKSWGLDSKIAMIERMSYYHAQQVAEKLLDAVDCADEIIVSVDDLGYIV